MPFKLLLKHQYTCNGSFRNKKIDWTQQTNGRRKMKRMRPGRVYGDEGADHSDHFTLPTQFTIPQILLLMKSKNKSLHYAKEFTKYFF